MCYPFKLLWFANIMQTSPEYYPVLAPIQAF